VSTTVRIPAPLRAYCGEQTELPVSASTVGEALVQLTTRYPGLRSHLFTVDGAVRGFVNVYVNDEDIRLLGGLGAVVREGDSLLIIPSVAGGHARVRHSRGDARVPAWATQPSAPGHAGP
jgi:molybdopterin converting factor small subunit